MLAVQLRALRLLHGNAKTGDIDVYQGTAGPMLMGHRSLSRGSATKNERTEHISAHLFLLSAGLHFVVRSRIPGL